jgi:hypothetical protein
MVEENSRFSMDWRLAFRLAVTLFWITAGPACLFTVVGLDRFVHLPTADIWSFLLSG